eukprot:3426071-Prymnesium_polylepis.1
MQVAAPAGGVEGAYLLLSYTANVAGYFGLLTLVKAQQLSPQTVGLALYLVGSLCVAGASP